MTLTAVANARAYAWSDWLIGIMRSFLSGGAAAFASLTGSAIAGVPSSQFLKIMGWSFVFMGLYRMGEFLQLHGAPDKLAETLDTAAAATKQAGQAIAEAKAQVPTDTK